MIDYNLILYIGLFLIISGFIIFIVNEIDKRNLDKKQFKQQQQLSKSFDRHKLKND